MFDATKGGNQKS